MCLRAATFPLPAKRRFMVRLRKRCQQAGLSDAQQDAIAAGNCLRLLGVAGISARPNVYALAGGNP